MIWPYLVRFCARFVVNPDTGCWEWTKGRRGGYASFYWLGRDDYGHRASYELFVGQIPAGLTIDHLCRVRHCVNPDHLEAVTQKVNTDRRPGAQSGRTHCPQGHPYAEFSRKRALGRDCLICHRDRERGRNRKEAG